MINTWKIKVEIKIILPVGWLLMPVLSDVCHGGSKRKEKGNL